MAEYTISKIKLPNGDICNIKDTTYNFNTTYNANTNKAATMADIKADNVKPIESASFTTGKYGQDGSGTHYYEMLGSITPSSFEQIWLLHYIISIEVPNDTTYTYRADVEIYGVRNTYAAYKVFNSLYSKYPIYQHVILEGASSSYPHEFGYRLASSYGDTTLNKNIRIDIIETRNCTATLFDAPKAYGSSISSNYTLKAFNASSNGLQETGDADTITRLYAGSNTMKTGAAMRLAGSSLFGFDRDNCAQTISLYNDGYTSTTTSINTARVYNEAGFDWTKGLFYNTSSNFATNTDINPGIDQSLHAIDFRYTDNCVASSALTTLGLERYKAVYLRGTIGTDGLFYLAPLTVSYNNQNYKRAWTQDIPTSADGYVYWFLGFPYYNSSYAGGYQLNFYLENKLFWYHNGKFQEYIGDAVTVNGHTVNKDVPSDAKFTDNNTTYTFENGTNGFKVTPSGGSVQTVTVTPSITNNVTGSGTSGYLAKFNGTNTITNGPQLGTSTTTFLNNKGEWATPTGNVTGVKGNSESSYRTGQVNLTAANVGAVAISGNETISGKKTLKFSVRIYPLVGTSNERSQWYKITFPYSTATTSSSANWFMNSFDLHFGGGYSQNPSGVAHVSFYWTRAKENGAWDMPQGSAKIEGILVNKIKFYYRIAEPGVLYVNNTQNVYNGIWLDNLYVDDTSTGLNWANTTIETCSAITISDYQNLPTVYTYSGNNDSNYYIDNNTTVNGTLTATSFSGPLNGNADTATTATNLAAKPSLATSGTTQITVTAGGKTSDVYTVPYATNASQLNGYVNPALTTAPDTGCIRYSYNVNMGTTGLFDSINNSNSILTLNRHNGNFDSQLGFSSNGKLYYRNFSSIALNTTTTWKQIAFTDSDITGNAATASSVALSGVTGADDLKAIEALSGTSGFLKKTAANTWSLDTNTYLTSSTGVTSIAGKTGAVTLADLGLSQALRFIGITSTSLSDGATTSTLVAKNDGSLIKTTGFVTGDVVIDTNSAYEYVWTGSAWERLGGDSSYKTTQTAKSDPTASTTTSTTFIDTISQDANGVITATKKTLPSYVATSAGVTAVTWDSTNNKLTRTINGSAADVVTIGTIKTALALTKSDVGLGNVANSTYAGGTAVTLNNSSKASSTASFYAPTTGGTANTQALVGNGATTSPKWVDISPSITIGAGTGSAAPTVNVTVLGQSGTAKSITTASTSVYGVTKLNDGIASNSTSLAATANSALVAAKKVASSNSTSKLYLVGATSQSTTGVDSYSYQYTYTNSGLLSALKLGLNLNGTEKAHLEWNNTDQSIDFIFN